MSHDDSISEYLTLLKALHSVGGHDGDGLARSEPMTNTYDLTGPLSAMLSPIQSMLGTSTLAIGIHIDRHQDFLICGLSGTHADVISEDAEHFVSERISRLARRSLAAQRVIADTLDVGSVDGLGREVRIIPFIAPLQCQGVIICIWTQYPNMDEVHPPYLRTITAMEAIKGCIVSAVEYHWERRAVSVYAALLEKAIPFEADLKQVSTDVAHAAVELANASGATVYWSSVDDRDNIYLQGHSGMSQRYETLKKGSKKLWLTGQVAQQRTTKIIENLSGERSAANRDIIEKEGHRAAVLVPIPASRIDGAICVYYKSDARVDRSTKFVLELLGTHMGAILDNRHAAISYNTLMKHIAETAHSLKSPMNRMATHAQNIAACVDKGNLDNIPRYCTALVEQARVARARIDSLLYVKPGTAEIARLHYELIALDQVITRVAERLQLRAQERHVKVDIGGSVGRLPAIECDPAKLDLVFENLLDNAIKYSWTGRTVVVHGAHAPKFVTLSVVDEGLGIPEDQYEAIFQPFSRSPVLDNERYIHGTGLGLSIARQLVRAHDGDITVQSEPFLDDPIRRARYEGFTTTFVVTLPRERK